MRIPFGDDWEERISAFVEAIAPVSNPTIANRGQLNEQRVANDQMVGKYGEFATEIYVVNTRGDRGVTPPDLAIHEDRRKAYFPPDLEGSDGTLYHVKSQHIARLASFPMSWVHERSDPVTMSVSVTDNDRMVYCEVDLVSRFVDIMLDIPAKELIERRLYVGLWNIKLRSKHCVCYNSYTGKCEGNTLSQSTACKECKSDTRKGKIKHGELYGIR